MVDDEPELLALYSEVLSLKGFQIEAAQDVPSALKRIGESQFQLVIADIGLPGARGTELVTWAKNHRPEMKVLLITGITHEDAFEILKSGGAGFLMKPLSPDELVAGVTATLNLGRDLELLNSGTLAAVSVGQFLLGQKASFPIYVHMPDGRFVKLADRGQCVNLPELSKFEDSKIYRLRVRQQDIGQYLSFCLAAARKASQSQDWPMIKRIRLCNHAVEVALESIRIEGLSANNIYGLMDKARDSSLLLGSCADTDDVLSLLQGGEDSLFWRSVMGANLAALCAHVIGWSSERMIDSFVLATLLKDVGLFALPASMQIPSDQFPGGEVPELYRKHPLRSMELLRDVRGIPKDVLLVIEQHHEGLAEQSYPLGIARSNMIPLARSVQGIDYFLGLVLELELGQGLARDHVLQIVFQMRQRGHENIICSALEALFRTASVAKAQESFRKEK